MRSRSTRRFAFIGTAALVLTAVGSVLVAAPASAAVAAANFSYTVAPGATLSVAAPGLLTGSTDTDGGTPSASFNTIPNDGTANVNSSGAFTYTADQGYTGPDSFTFQVCDSVTFNCATGTVSITVTAPAPTVQNQSYTVRPGTTLVIGVPGVLTGASAPNGDAMTATEEGYTSQGVLSLSNTGAFNYQAPSGYLGTDSFSYKACDSVTGLCSATATVVLNITAATPTVATQSYVTKPKEPLSDGAPGLLEGSTGPSGDTLQAEIVSYPASGTVTVDNDGAFIYTPDQFTNFLGIDSFTYKACDTTTGLCSGAADVNIQVGTPPTIHGPSLLRVLPNHQLTRVVYVTGDPLPRLTMHGRLLPGLRLLHRGKARVIITGSPSRLGSAVLVFTASNGVSPARRLVFRIVVQLHPRPQLLAVVATPKTLPASGGVVRVLVRDKFATTCTVAVLPRIKGFPRTFRCTAGHFVTAVRIAKNTAPQERSIRFRVFAKGPGGRSSIRVGLVSQATDTGPIGATLNVHDFRGAAAPAAS